MDSRNTGSGSKAAKISAACGTGLGLLQLGLGLIGITVNIYLGAAALLATFACFVYAFWTWEKASRFHVALRIGTVSLAAVVYFGLTGRQVVSQYKADHPVKDMTNPSLTAGTKIPSETENAKPEHVGAKDKAAVVAQPKSLQIKFSEHPPYRWEGGGQIHFRFAVYNPSGRSAAENVQVSLTDIAPRPRDTQFSGDFPYPVYSEQLSQGVPVLINPDTEHLFEIAMVWKGGEDGKQLIVGGLGKQPGNYNSGIFMDRDEVWHLHMRVTAANARPFEIVFKMWADNGSIHLRGSNQLDMAKGHQKPRAHPLGVR